MATEILNDRCQVPADSLKREKNYKTQTQKLIQKARQSWKQNFLSIFDYKISLTGKYNFIVLLLSPH